MGSDSEDFKFNLDTKDAVASAMNLKETILSVGDSKNLSGLINSFTSLAGPVALAGAAIFAVKTSLDLVREGEEINKINKMFDEMASSAGQSANVMREGIEKATKGMVDMEDALKSASKVMYDLGPNAAKIPQLFEIARKAGKVYGGETTENFEKISMAIATGNTRMLRQIGLKVDAEAVEKKYALSLGKTVQTLTAMEKQTAILNAVMDKGNEKFKSAGSAQESISEKMTKLGIVFKELHDSIALVFEKALGPMFKKAIEMVTGGVKSLSDTLKGNFGSAVDQASHKLEKYTDLIKYHGNEMKRIEGIVGSTYQNDSMWKSHKEQLDRYTASIDKMKSKVEEAKAAEEAAAPQASEAPERFGPTPEELAKQKQAEAAFQRELLGLKEQRLSAEMEIETNAEKFHDDLIGKRILTEDQYDARIEEIKSKAAQGDVYTAEQAAEEIAQIEAEKAAKIQKINQDMAEDQLRVYDNQVAQAKTASDGIAAAFAQGSARARKDNQDFGKQGQQVFGSLRTNAVSAFKAMGDGSKSAGEAIKGFLLNSVADYFEMKGEGMLLEGIWPPNPAAIAAGGGLIALSAAMRSASGSGGGGSSGGAGGGAGGGGGGFGPSSGDISSSKPTPEEQKKKSVTIQVQGNYFETEQSKQRMLEMIRENTDATDFKYQQIGVG